MCSDGAAPPCSPVVPVTTLDLSKSAQDMNGVPLLVGDVIRYTLTVENTGGYTAYNVSVTDDLPADVTCASLGCTDPLTWHIDTLAPGDSQSYSFEVTVNPGTEGQTITNTATVTASNVTPPPDPSGLLG